MTANTVRVLIDELVLVILNNGENTWSRAGIYQVKYEKKSNYEKKKNW